MESRIYTLVHRELTGEITPSEAKELSSLRSDSQSADLAEDISLIWNVSKDYFPRQDWNKGSAKAKFLNNIRSEKTIPSSPVTTTTTTKSTNYFKIGAAVILLVALAYLAKAYLPTVFNQSKEVDNDIITTEEIQYASLDDNSQLWVGPNSTITDISYTANSRSLTLEGEALFDVSHDPERPFTISLGKGVNIEVLGTSFKAISVDEEGAGQVIVRDGRVRLYSTVGEKSNVIVEAGETGMLNTSTDYANSFNTSTNILLGDLQGLALKDLPLDKAFEKLGKHFGVRFNVEGQVDGCNFNSTLVGEQSISDVIKSISATYPKLKISSDSRSTYTVSGTCG